MDYFEPLEATANTLNAQLYANESIHAQVDGVGLYHGKQKDPAHDNGRLYLTTHRLVYLDHAQPLTNSCHLSLVLVRQTEHWAGFLKSSAKITLLLARHAAEISPEAAVPPSAKAWVCQVCGFSNAPSPACTLCGVKRTEGFPSNRSSPALAPPRAQSDPVDHACPVCTFMNHPSLHHCEICGSDLGRPLALLSTKDLSGSSSRSETPEPSASTPTPDFVRLSFRKGGDKAFYATLKKTLLTKAWEAAPPQDTQPVDGLPESFGGINGILQNIDLNAQGRSDEMQDALSDLKSLMVRAKEMVELARMMNAKLPQGSSDDPSAKLIRSTMANLGLPSPVTNDMVKDERQYHQELAIELSGLLTGSALTRGDSPQIKEPLMADDGEGRGLMVLDEVWCIWNRARALVSPNDFRQACNWLPTYTWPSIELRTFASGLTVLHTKRFKEAAFQVRISNLLSSHPQNGLSTLEIAQMEKLPVGLALEMLEAVEVKSGAFVRDDKGHDGLRWFPNLILTAVWDDPNFT